MFKISDNLHSSFLIKQILNVLFLQMKQRLPFWELSYGHCVYYVLYGKFSTTVCLIIFSWGFFFKIGSNYKFFILTYLTVHPMQIKFKSKRTQNRQI